MKVLVLSSHTPSLFWFRLEMMKDFLQAGYKVVAVGNESEKKWRMNFYKYGIEYRQIYVQKNGTNPIYDLKTLKSIKNILREEKPDKIFSYQAKTVVYGGIAAHQLGIKEVYSLIAGVGSVFLSHGLKNRIIEKILIWEYRIALKYSKVCFFQNYDDSAIFIKKKIINRNKIEYINGSGVNIERFHPMELPEKPTILNISRLIKDKGIYEYLEACKILKHRNGNIRCLLVGPFDTNPTALSEKDLQSYIDEGIVEYFGEQKDVLPYLEKCSLFVLPSYHEGTPKTVLEAMACGRTVITTDAPGCRETVEDGVNGYLVKVKDIEGLVEKILSIVDNRELLSAMGREGRKIAEEKYDVKKINNKIKNIMNIGDKKMSLYEELINGKEKLSLVGLGYVGMPIAVAFAKKIKVIGYDLNEGKIELYKSGIDPTKEVGNEKIKSTSVEFTSDETKLREAKFHIVAVPTPVYDDHTPDLTPVEGASRILGRNLTKGSVIVFESTVYPGVTEEVCVPILEKESGLKCGVDFKVGYSPERINPGDKIHRLETIKKIVSGMDEETLDIVAKVYELVVDAGVHRASCIKVAEAAKVIENSQRDINIAFMNELSIIFNKLGIDTKSVLEAAGTKWNFLKFYPGLVGGHCIGVDPYYLTYKAEMLGYHSQVILAGRRINDDMGKYVAENLVKNLIKSEKSVKNARVAILGFTFKENCPDTRNSKVFDIVKELREYGIEPIVTDPVADVAEAKRLYGLEFADMTQIQNMDAVILAVAHDAFSKLSMEDINKFFGQGQKVLLDIKGLLDRQAYEKAGYNYWRL